MPRSRRKAAASRAQAKGITKDFVKKKERLGRKKRPDNQTDVDVRARQIYLVGGLDEEAVLLASIKKGLTLAQLVTRAAHYSSKTRLSALNGLTKALIATDFAASVHARSDRARVLRIGLTGLQDEDHAVRGAAKALVSAALAQAPKVRPFASLLAATLVACLSHIRTEVQITAAQTVCAIFRDAGVSPFVVFGVRRFIVVKALSDLLVLTKLPKNRTVVLDAILAILKPREELVNASRSVLKKEARPFYYHQLDADGDENELQDVKDDSGLLKEMESVFGELTKRVANITMECLPVHEAKKDNAISSLLFSAARTLHCTISSHNLTKASLKLVSRVLEPWSKERNRHHDRGNVRLVHNYLASCALAVSNWKCAAAYIVLGLDPDVTSIPEGQDQLDPSHDISCSLENATEHLLMSCSDASIRSSVLEAWSTRWYRGIDCGNVYYIAANLSIVKSVIDEFMKCLLGKEPANPELERIGWDILVRLPYVVEQTSACYSNLLCADPVANNEVLVLRRFVHSTLCIVSRATRIVFQLHKNKSAELKDCVKKQLLNISIITTIDKNSVNEYLAVLYYSHAFASSSAMRVLVSLLATNKDVAHEFGLGLLSLIDNHFTEFEQSGAENISLDLFAALTLISEMQTLPDECVYLANRLIERFSCE